MVVADTYKALGDPVRLEIIEKLCSGSIYTLSSLSEDFSLSRQGVRKHVQVLSNAGIVNIKSSGRNTNLPFVPEALVAANSYMDQLERKWEIRLAALKAFAERGV